MSPFAGTIETMSLKFLFNENAVNHSSKMKKNLNHSAKLFNGAFFTIIELLSVSYFVVPHPNTLRNTMTGSIL